MVSITPALVSPFAPTGVSAVAGNQQATVSFTPPTVDGGAPITSYTVYATAKDRGFDQVQSGSGSPIIVRNLTAGRALHVHGHRNEPGRQGTSVGAVQRGSSLPHPGPADNHERDAG